MKNQFEMMIRVSTFLMSLCGAACINNTTISPDEARSAWLLVDDFEYGQLSDRWTRIDAQNDTEPYVSDPQVAEIRSDPETGNRFMLRKPAADGVVGNRKALGFMPLPVTVQIDEIYTLYARINVEYFPNNQSFGLSNVPISEIADQAYDSFEPMVRITDKRESDGHKNDGTLMVLSGYKTYSKIINYATGIAARPLEEGQWYELWCVVNNAPIEAGGQRYDLYLRGGEFAIQQLVFSDARFRMQRTLPLTYFITISNTGPLDDPYGNGGVKYDDIYLARGRVLSAPARRSQDTVTRIRKRFRNE